MYSAAVVIPSQCVGVPGDGWVWPLWWCKGWYSGSGDTTIFHEGVGLVASVIGQAECQ